MAYNENDHPREPGTGKWRDKEKQSPDSLPREDQIRQYFDGITEQLDQGKDLSDSDTTLMMRSSDEQMLQTLIEYNRPEFDWRLIQNRHVPEEQALELIDRQTSDEWDSHLRIAACNRQGMSPEFAQKCESWTYPDSGLSAKTRKYCVINLAHNKGTRPEVIQHLVDRFPSRDVAKWAMNNPACNDETLAKAFGRVKDEADDFTLDSLASNPSAGLKTLHAILDTQPSSGVKERVFSNPNLDSETLSNWRTYSENDSYPVAACGIARNPNLTPELEQDLYKTGDWNVASQLGQNPKTPKHIINDLYQQNDSRMDESLPRNPGLDESLAQGISNRASDKIAIYNILNNKGLSLDFRKKILNEHKELSMKEEQLS